MFACDFTEAPRTWRLDGVCERLDAHCWCKPRNNFNGLMIFKPISIFFFLLLLLRLLLFVAPFAPLFSSFAFVLRSILFSVFNRSLFIFFIFQCNCHLAQQSTHATHQPHATDSPPAGQNGIPLRFKQSKQLFILFFFFASSFFLSLLSFVGVAHNVYCPISRVCVCVIMITRCACVAYNFLIFFFFLFVRIWWHRCIDLSTFIARIEKSTPQPTDWSERYEVCVKEKKM